MARATIKAGKGIATKRKSNKLVIALLVLNLISTVGILLKLYGVI